MAIATAIATKDLNNTGLILGCFLIKFTQKSRKNQYDTSLNRYSAPTVRSRFLKIKNEKRYEKITTTINLPNILKALDLFGLERIVYKKINPTTISIGQCPKSWPKGKTAKKMKSKALSMIEMIGKPELD